MLQGKPTLRQRRLEQYKKQQEDAADVRGKITKKLKVKK